MESKDFFNFNWSWLTAIKDLTNCMGLIRCIKSSIGGKVIGFMGFSRHDFRDVAYIKTFSRSKQKFQKEKEEKSVKRKKAGVSDFSRRRPSGAIHSILFLFFSIFPLNQWFTPYFSYIFFFHYVWLNY